MATTNCMLVVGRIGADARQHVDENGRASFRFSVATEKIVSGGEKQVCWVPCAYWTSAEREIEYLAKSLLKGALVAVTGGMYSRRHAHSEYPVEILSWDLHVDKVEVLVKAAEQRPEPPAASPPPEPDVARPTHASPAPRNAVAAASLGAAEHPNFEF